MQEANVRGRQSQQEARVHGQSWRKPNKTDSLCRNGKLANSFIPCEDYALQTNAFINL